MGGIGKKVKKTAKKIKKEVSDLPKDIVKVTDKTIVEPLEKPVKKVINVVEQVGADIVEPLEKPVKKLTKEIVETVTGTDKRDYRLPQQSVQTPEITPEVVEDEKPSIMTRYATRGKRSGQAGTIIEGYGVIQRKKSPRAVT